VQAVAGDLILEAGDERRVGRDQANLAAQRAGVQHGGLAQPGHRDPHRGPCLRQAGFLEVADHERVISLLLGGERVRDHLCRTAELGDRVRVPGARLDAEHLHLAAWAGHRAEIPLEPGEVRAVGVRVGEALVPDPRVGYSSHPSSSRV
jgi:hypothetical protein